MIHMREDFVSERDTEIQHHDEDESLLYCASKNKELAYLLLLISA